MKTKNLTPFPLGTKVTSRRPPRPEMTIVVRACYVIAPGGALALPESVVSREANKAPPGRGYRGPDLLAQGPMSAETYREDDEERAGECLYPGDFADWKPRAEVMLRGTCHTPGGKPLSECPVRFSVGGLSKILRVVGRRFWSDDGAGAVMSQAAPFSRMPVDYAHAFGGPGYAQNPVGLGFAGRELPNVEHPGAPIRERKDDPGPAGFGPVSSAWPDRKGRLGKEYGRRWRKERAPYHAEDLDWKYFLAAPPDQQIEGYLKGDETLLFQNLHPSEPVLESRLPGLRIRAFVKDAKERFREVGMSLDTVFADLDQGKIYLTWRGLDAIESPDQRDVLWALVASEKLSEPKAPEARYREQLAAFEADPLEIRERLPAELFAQFEEMKERQKARAEGREPVHAEPAPDPMTAAVRRRMDAMPVAVPGAEELEKKVAAAVAGAMAGASPGADVKALVGSMAAENEAARGGQTRFPPFPLRPGGPPPPAAAMAVREGLSKVEAARKGRAGEGLSKAQAEEIARLDAQIEAMKREPLLRAALERPGPKEPLAGEDLSGQDYEGRDLRGADLRGAVLSDASLAGANLSGAKLRGAKLDGAMLNGADLTGADLTGADLTLANFTGVRAPGAIFREAILDRAFFQKADLKGAVFAGARGEMTFLTEADLGGADARGLSLVRAFAKGASLARADLSGASLIECLFLEIDATKAKLTRATLSRTTFLKSELREAVLAHARGDRTGWLGSSMQGADFGHAILPAAQLVEVKAPGAGFRRAFLKEARFTRSSLERADFTESQLFGADFGRCTLSGARFTGANLFEANLMEAAGAGCDFTGANLSRARVEET